MIPDPFAETVKIDPLRDDVDTFRHRAEVACDKLTGIRAEQFGALEERKRLGGGSGVHQPLALAQKTGGFLRSLAPVRLGGGGGFTGERIGRSEFSPRAGRKGGDPGS